jgi:hypothetical protein
MSLQFPPYREGPIISRIMSAAQFKNDGDKALLRQQGTLVACCDPAIDFIVFS